MDSPQICLVIALPAEARPVRHHFHLQRDQKPSPFPLYRNSDIALVLSGPGKAAAREATAWLHERLKPDNCALWFNLGIAGHPERRVGQVVVASTVEDRSSGECWNTRLPAELPTEQERLITLDTPDLEYSQTAVVDMEAAGFYGAALEFADPEQIGCIKIISDNREQPADQINGKWVSELIGDRLDLINEIVECFKP
jgi:nucleoside phosphorylase